MRWLCGICGLLATGYVSAQEPTPLAPIAPTIGRESGELPPRTARLRWRPEVRPVSHETAVDSHTARREADDLFQDVRRRGAAGLGAAERDLDDTLAATRDKARTAARRRLDAADDEGFGRRLGRVFNFDRDGLFCSDHDFDSFVSPVTNPFLFEDPRSLSEVRALGIYQRVPTSQPNFQGGSLWYVGVRGSLAITNRISVTLNKVGLSGVSASGDSDLGSHVGLSELWFGPKVTIVRDVDFGTLLAAGLQFQLPVGSSAVYQNTGKLSVVPYVSVGQSFLKTRLGSFNTLANAGYSFSTNNQRSDYLYASGHLSFDVMNRQKFFPLVELNWFHYTTNGNAQFLAGEGRDLVNFGSLAKGSSLLTGAVGARYRYTKRVEFGGAFEVPIAGNRDFFRYRLLFDVSFRF